MSARHHDARAQGRGAFVVEHRLHFGDSRELHLQVSRLAAHRIAQHVDFMFEVGAVRSKPLELDPRWCAALGW